MPTDSGGWPETSFLEELEPALRQKLLLLGRERRYDCGETILHQGRDGRSVVILLEGLVKISSLSPTGHESLLDLRTRGDLLGEMAFATGSSRSASVVAATVVRARVISEAELAVFLRRHPTLATEIMAVVARKLSRANARRAEFQSLTARARAALMLVDVAGRAGVRTEEGIAIGPELIQADLASLATVAVRTFEKQLQQFEREELVRRHRRELVIIDVDGLGKIGGFGP